MQIRPTSAADSRHIAQIRRENGVREGVIALTSERNEVTEKFIKSLTERDRAYVAEENGCVVGLAVMVAKRSTNKEHCASIAIMVSTEFHGRGIGSALMEKILDDADNTLRLHRVELMVLVDNDRAINLYKKFGFEREATRKHAAVKDGVFVDEYLYARVGREAE